MVRPVPAHGWEIAHEPGLDVVQFNLDFFFKKKQFKFVWGIVLMKMVFFLLTLFVS